MPVGIWKNSNDQTHPVGTTLQNSFGLGDMHGNVAEWCNDWYYYGYYRVSPGGNPTGPAEGTYRVTRGGHWDAYEESCRSASRFDAEHDVEYQLDPAQGHSNVGFRVVRGSLGSLADNFTITGTVTGADEVTVTLSGDKTESQVVNEGELYIFIVKEDGTYTVSAQASGHEFLPGSAIYSDVSSNIIFNITTDPVIVDMIEVPTGSFNMGTDSGERWEMPVHEVAISGFEMGVYEITWEQYESLMNGIHVSTHKSDLPVEGISYRDAIRFCNRLSEQRGYESCYDETTWQYTCDFSKNGFRLPTEAEWEYACRARTETVYNTGESETDLAEAGWYSENSDAITHPVGQKTPNAWGLYDMHGNVWEWCNDWYKEDYYSLSPLIDPAGPSINLYRVIRGGCWSSIASQCESARRGWVEYRRGVNTIGMRVVRRP